MNETSSRHFEESPERIASRLMQKASYQDGLGEIAAGLTLLTFAGLYGLQLATQPGSPVYKASNYGVLAMMFLIAIPIYGSRWVIRKVRMRFLIGTVGYVKLRPLNRKQFGRMVVAGAVGLVVAVVVAYIIGSRQHLTVLSWMLAGNGLSGGLLAFVGFRNTRYMVAGGLMAVIGFALALSRASLISGMAVLFGFMGIFCLVSGSIALWTLLRAPAEIAE